jgi:hypothetical protein
LTWYLQLAWRVVGGRIGAETLAPTEQLIGVDVQFTGNQRYQCATDQRTRHGGALEFIAVLAIRASFRPCYDWLNYCVHK